jgi:signal transduction histidine kinase
LDHSQTSAAGSISGFWLRERSLLSFRQALHSGLRPAFPSRSGSWPTRRPRVDLDQLDQQFSTGRTDELGALARLLDDMTTRLRAGATRIREVERRAATGELARQVNHDIKNGLAPIRHVVRHLGQVAQQTPEQLAAVFTERQGTLQSSVEYLENLARNYARLSPHADRGSANLNTIVQDVVSALATDTVSLESRLDEKAPRVRADALALRRIVENLAANAVDAARENGGRVWIETGKAGGDGVSRVRLVVGDTGGGMTREQLDHAFDDFYTTKEGGTGLGLSVVRRLILDLGGTIRVETAPGEGSRFIVEVPGVES